SFLLFLVITSRVCSFFFSFSISRANYSSRLFWVLGTECWVLSFSHKPLHRRQQLLCRKRLHYVAVGSLLLSPELVASAAFRAHQHHRDMRILRLIFQLAARLKAVTRGHHHVHQDQAGPLRLDDLLQPGGFVDGN